jgi:hypothetical protein
VQSINYEAKYYAHDVTLEYINTLVVYRYVHTSTASLISSVTCFLALIHSPSHVPDHPVQIPPASTISQNLLCSPLNMQQLLRYLLKVGNLTRVSGPRATLVVGKFKLLRKTSRCNRKCDPYSLTYVRSGQYVNKK